MGKGPAQPKPAEGYRMKTAPGTGNLTAAAAFRAVEKYKPTLLIDEADTTLAFTITEAGMNLRRAIANIGTATNSMSPTIGFMRRKLPACSIRKQAGRRASSI